MFLSMSLPVPHVSKFTVYQLRITLSVCFLSLSSGTFLGYTSSAIHSLSEDSSFPPLRASDIGWIGSLGPLGAFCGCLFTAAVIPRLGPRRIILYFAAPCFLTSWFGIYFSVSALGIFLARFLGGVGTGITTSSAPLYVIGIASIQNRGRPIILPQLLMLIGIVISFSLGSILDWADHAAFCGFLVLPAFALIPSAPDNPRWLLQTGKPDLALDVLETLNEKSAAMEEYDRLRNQVKIPADNRTLSWKTRPILTALGIMTFQQFTGINGVTFYAIMIFEQSSPGVAAWGSHVPVISLAVTQCLASITSTFLIDKAGRKVLLMISAVLTSLGSGSLEFYFFLGADHPDLSWIPLVILIIFAWGFAIGFGPVPWLIVTEILPEEIRQVVNPFVQAYTWLCTFDVTKSFPLLLEVVNIYGIFWIYAMSSAVGLFFVIFCVPETKGKSLQQVQEEFIVTEKPSDVTFVTKL